MSRIQIAYRAKRLHIVQLMMYFIFFKIRYFEVANNANAFLFCCKITTKSFLFAIFEVFFFAVLLIFINFAHVMEDFIKQ